MTDRRAAEFTPRPWVSHIREMTDADGRTRRKCFIEKDGVALAQFANFGDEDEWNATLAAAAPEMYGLLADLLGELERDELPVGDRPGAYARIAVTLARARGKLAVEAAIEEEGPAKGCLVERWLEEYRRGRRAHDGGEARG